MRSNGLTARAYRPVADLSPQVGDALLDELKAQGVAAYTTPVESSTTAGFDRPEFRVSVLERLYVDSAASEVVREMISQQHLMIADDSEDLTWAQIVAGFDQPLTAPVAPWPAQEDLNDPPTADGGGPFGDGSPAGGSSARRGAAGAGRHHAGSGWRRSAGPPAGDADDPGLGARESGFNGDRDGQAGSSDPSAREPGSGGHGLGQGGSSGHGLGQGGSSGHDLGQADPRGPGSGQAGPRGPGSGQADPRGPGSGEPAGGGSGAAQPGFSGGLGGLAGRPDGFADAGDSTISASGGSARDGGGAEAAQLGRAGRWMRARSGTRGFDEERRHGRRGRHHRRGGDAVGWGRRTGSRTRRADYSDRSDLAWSAYEAGVDGFDDEIAEVDRFVPPVPPPLPKLTGWQKLTWLGLGGGPLVFLVAALGQLTLPPWLSFLAVVGFVGGFVGLVIMLTSHSDDEWDPDHGAQV
ncbi:MAG TPA: hypothetical protein VFI30_04730 [Nocardioidaceae bacterium]|nr:hypothetical protein [Nocardioidaceae bacterium]